MTDPANIHAESAHRRKLGILKISREERMLFGSGSDCVAFRIFIN